MPSDIRSFFGGNASSAPAVKQEIKKDTKKRGRQRKVVEDDEDDDDEPASKRATPQKKTVKQEVVLEETTAGDFFGTGSKPKRSSEVTRTKGKTKSAEEDKKATPKKRGRAVNGNGSARSSARKAKHTSYVELDEMDFPDDNLNDDEDNFKADAKRGRRAGDDYKEDSEDDDVPLLPKKREAKTQKKIMDDEDDGDDDFAPDADVDMKDVNGDDDFLVPDDEEEIVEDKGPKKVSKPATGGRKRKSTALYDDGDGDGDDLEVEPAKPAAKKRATPVKKGTAASKKQKDVVEDSAEMKEILASIPTIKAPSPPPKGDKGEQAKFPFGGQHPNTAVPAGAIDISDVVGADNCLAGLSFVFTGQLQCLGREQGQNLVKQYGGKVMSAASKKTSYVVLGEDAGPNKLKLIKEHNLKVINEDGLFELIRRLPENGGDSAAADENKKKKEKEDEKIREAAEEMERQEREQERERAKLAAAKVKAKPVPQRSSDSQSTSLGSQVKASAQGPDTRLWTVRYAPQQIGQICGNKGQVEKLQKWLKAFPMNQRTKFKKPGPDGSGTFRAVIIHGPPGIGKTTAAHLVAKLEGYDIVESNASDTRSKKLVETGLKGVLSTTSLMGYFGAPGTTDVDASKKKLVLIMDEVDGMSAGDRGGVGALAAVCKKSQVPMILICNDRKQQKMKPFDFVTYDMPFRRPTADMIRSRIMTIAYREKLEMPANVVNALIEGSGADIRQVVNMLSTARLDSTNLSFAESKDMSKAWEKHIVLKPWDMVGKILGGGLFNPASKSSLNEKQELYFNDHEFAPLMLQENYLGTNPQRTNMYNDAPKAQKNLAALDLVSKAADAISDGDLVDRMIHGSQQQWSLMPVHAMFSFVRPASYVYGSMAGHQTRFTAWLGKNSNQGKLMRMLKEIQGHMRLRVSADRFEVRQTYLPVLFELLIRRLQNEGKDSVEDIIELMDQYYLTKDDWDAVLELGIGADSMESIKIESKDKAAFTRTYNVQSHPLPFIKASQVVVAGKKAKENPDLEEAIEESEEEGAVEGVEAAEEEEGDISKDKYIKAPKKKKGTAAGKKAAGAGKKKGKKGGDEDEDDEEMDNDEDVKPKKGAKGKGRSKK